MVLQPTKPKPKVISHPLGRVSQQLGQGIRMGLDLGSDALFFLCGRWAVVGFEPMGEVLRQEVQGHYHFRVSLNVHP